MNKNIFVILIFIFGLLTLSCGKKTEQSSSNELKNSVAVAKVTFIELGSVSCIPCRLMQPVMKSIEAKYGGQVKVVFYDVRKDKRPAVQYRINLIPTQVFLDESGNEILRHEGFFAEEEIDRFLTSRGLSIIQ
jgi:thioredoxin 1